MRASCSAFVVKENPPKLEQKAMTTFNIISRTDYILVMIEAIIFLPESAEN
jgi:hypothetical protein